TEAAPSATEPYDLFGELFARTGRHQDAVTAIRKARELKATNFGTDKLLAEELTALGRWEEAVAVLQNATALRRRNTSHLLLDAAKLWRPHGKPEEAAKASQQATPAQPAPAGAWEGLAAARLDQGRFAEARAAVVEPLKRFTSAEARRPLQ